MAPPGHRWARVPTSAQPSAPLQPLFLLGPHWADQTLVGGLPPASPKTPQGKVPVAPEQPTVQ